MGRPLIADTVLCYDVKVRLDEKTHNELLKYCEEHNENKASVIRKSIKEYIKEK